MTSGPQVLCASGAQITAGAQVQPRHAPVAEPGPQASPASCSTGHSLSDDQELA